MQRLYGKSLNHAHALSQIPFVVFFFYLIRASNNGWSTGNVQSKKALNDQTVCLLFYASNVIQTFTFFKYDRSRLEIPEGGKKVGREREKGDQVKNFYYVNRP